jgi:hypothetical protein
MYYTTVERKRKRESRESGGNHASGFLMAIHECPCSYTLAYIWTVICTYATNRREREREKKKEGSLFEINS